MAATRLCLMGLTQRQGPHPAPLPPGEGTPLRQPFQFTSSERSMRPLARRERVGVRGLPLRETKQSGTHFGRITF